MSAIGAVGVLGASIACTAFVDIDVEQCMADSDCSNRGFTATRCVDRVCTSSLAAAVPDADAVEAATNVDPKWGCLGNVHFPPQDTSVKVLKHAAFIHFLSDAPIPGLELKACGRIDVSCTQPLATLTTGSDGQGNMLIPQWFDGFYSLAPPPSFPDMVPSEVYLAPQGQDADLDASLAPSNVARLLSASELNYLLGEIGSAFDPSLGHVLGYTVDCQDNITGGVSVRSLVRGPKTVSAYGTSIDAQETAERGEFAIINLPPGPTTIEATLASVGKKIGAVNVILRPGHITYIRFFPTPLP